MQIGVVVQTFAYECAPEISVSLRAGGEKFREMPRDRVERVFEIIALFIRPVQSYFTKMHNWNNHR